MAIFNSFLYVYQRVNYPVGYTKLWRLDSVGLSWIYPIKLDPIIGGSLRIIPNRGRGIANHENLQWGWFNVGYRLVSCTSVCCEKMFKTNWLSSEWRGGLYCERFFLRSIFSGEVLSTFTHLSLGKAGPVTLENHIHAKALKMQGSPDN